MLDLDKEYKLNLDDLTPKQYKRFMSEIYNGVGSNDVDFIDPHDLIFKKAAEYHDFAYWRGGTDEDRRICDYIFLLHCLEATRKEKWYYRPFYYGASYVYYLALVLFGRYAFEYKDEPSPHWDHLILGYLQYKSEDGSLSTRMKRKLKKRIRKILKRRPNL